jgi:hypothetical protein
MLKALRAVDAVEPDCPLPCLAVAAAFFVAFQWLSLVTHSIERPFVVLVGLGALGAAVDIARKARAAVADAGALAALARSYEWVIATGLLASPWDSGSRRPGPPATWRPGFPRPRTTTAGFSSQVT